MAIDQVMPFSEDWVRRALAEVQTQIRELQGARALESASIAKGGLRLIEDASLKMVSSLGVTVLYVGPDSLGRQVLELRRRDGSMMMRTQTNANGNVFWSLWDRTGHLLMADDSNTGVGLGTPWQSIPMYPKVWPTTFLDAENTDLSLPTSACTGGAVWEGLLGRNVHATMWVDMVCGRMTGVSGSPTYSLVVNGDVLGSWSQTSYAYTLRGPYDIKPYITFEHVPVQIKVSATGTGTDRIAAQMVSTHCRGG